MSLVIIRKTARADAWLDALTKQMPGLDVRVWPDTGPVEEVDYVLCWSAGPSVIASFPNLKVIFSLGAGVDHILQDETVPTSLPVVRMMDPSLNQGMTQFLVLVVLRHHRCLEQMEQNQASSLWQRPERQPARIGIMGFGELGTSFGQAIAALGFEIAGWSRRRKAVEGAVCYAGQDELPAFLARTDILVNLLPQTAATENILNSTLFAALPRGAYLVNVGRGEHLVEADLIGALDDGLLSGAALDVFREEPLSKGHPFWTHPSILVTPHIASATNPQTAAIHVASNIRRFETGKSMTGQVDRDSGY